MLGVAIIHDLRAAGHAGLAHLHLGWGIVSTCGHAVGDHGWAVHRVEAVLPVVGAHMEVQSHDQRQGHQKQGKQEHHGWRREGRVGVGR